MKRRDSPELTFGSTVADEEAEGEEYSGSLEDFEDEMNSAVTATEQATYRQSNGRPHDEREPVMIKNNSDHHDNTPMVSSK